MVVAGFCARGKLRIHRIESKAKVNAAYFQENVMDPNFDDIPWLYGADTSKLWIHMDKVSSHTARSS
ncbi:hypothetical protein L9F63_012932 [Diploptera punctata]|uniref:Transposase n=1 Tax=Diploptera punctata TaxID=6984 RepID=A0AAD8EMN7_DIPPU|nr:hypothetical protein L9F63_012932 [Diploptera punctata]